MQTVVSHLPSLCLHWSSSTFEHRIGEINKSVQTRATRRRSSSSQTANKTRLKSGSYTGSLLSHSLPPSPTSRVLLRLQCPKSQTALLIAICLGYMRLIIIKRIFFTKNNTVDKGPLSKKLDISIEQKQIQPTCGVPLQSAASSDARSVVCQTF